MPATKKRACPIDPSGPRVITLQHMRAKKTPAYSGFSHMPTNPYTANFYNTYLEESRASARGVLPHVLRLFNPSSVIDVGCGVGTWLSVFSEFGIGRMVGIDGDYVDRSQLLIDAKSFQSHDLSRPLKLNGDFDLAISMEVAEHIEEASAQTFVESLTRLAPAILFSAAIPHQGGDNHINEQWPEYWVERFARQSYVAYDCIRPLIWEDESISYHYAQNSFAFVKRERVADYPALLSMTSVTAALARVHPRRWEEANDPRRQHLGPVLNALPHSLSNAVTLRVRRTLGLR